MRARERLSRKSFATMQWTDPVGLDRQGRTTHPALHRSPRRRSTPDSASATPVLSWCIDSQIPELLTLAATVDAWWPEIQGFVANGITNARSEGYNRLVKHVKRAACGFRNPNNSARRTPFHCTSKQRTATQFSFGD
nr:transposase [Mycobacterium riyadhense]